jgi:hypothetical protein
LKSLVIYFISLPIYVNAEIYKLNAKNKEKENNTIKQILYYNNNHHNTSHINKLIPAKIKTRLNRKDTSKTKWTKVT